VLRFLPRLARETVVVHTLSGTSLRGVLVASYRDCLVLAHATYLGTDTTIKVDGESVIPREQIAWIQRLGGAQ
jgi:hypothetical protein